MKPDLQRLVPPGIDPRKELKWMFGGWMLSFFYSMGLVLRYEQEYRWLFTTIDKRRVLQQGVLMPDFADLLGSHLYGFLIVALCMLAVVIYHYVYHRQGSRSIYLMRRLPDSMELHRRCWALPVLCALASILLAFVMLLIYYAIYMLATPDACLSPGQWEKLWRSVIL